MFGGCLVDAINIHNLSWRDISDEYYAKEGRIFPEAQQVKHYAEHTTYKSNNISVPTVDYLVDKQANEEQPYLEASSAKG